MGFSDARGEFNFASPNEHTCEYRRFGRRMSPIGLGAEAEACLRLEGGNITSISRLPPYAIVADAGVRLTASLWACRSQVMYHKR